MPMRSSPATPGDHDLEGAYFHTSLGQDIDTQENRPNGHYHHLDTINRVRYWGSIERFIEEEGVRDGIMNALVRNGVPYVLAGSIRDDGPLPACTATPTRPRTPCAITFAAPPRSSAWPPCCTPSPRGT